MKTSRHQIAQPPPSPTSATLHPRIVQYASLLGVESQRFWLVLKGKEKAPDLLERFRTIRRLEYRPIPLKILRGTGEKKARKPSAKPEATK